MFFIMIMSAQVNNNFSKCKAKNLNRSQHICNGNIKSNLKILHWNKGNSNFYNKIDNVYTILDQNKPNIFSVVEANYSFSDKINIRDYSIEFSRLHISSTFSRNLILIKDSISYNRRYDLENKYIATVWIEINISKKSKILVCSYYRQWSIPNELQINESVSSNAQISRFKILVYLWTP